MKKSRIIFKLTGHTGFKGSWMSCALVNAGAKVVGYSSCSKDEVRLFDLCGVKEQIAHIKGDVQNLGHLKEVFSTYQPEIVIHMAAQPIVRESYQDPVGTYNTNVMGTVNLMECIRLTPSVNSVLNVTTDKVYKNREWCWGYREDEMLDGYDPYSNSKSCSELVTHSYVNSFFNADSSRSLTVSTARAGNVIGGGDFSENRIIPDCVRSVESNQEMIVRNPNSTRPYQHVLEPLFAYLMIAARQYENNNLQGYYNVGPDDKDCVTTRELVELFKDKWNSVNSENFTWCDRSNPNAPHEANFLKLDCSKIKSAFKWKTVLGIDDAVRLVCEFTRVYMDKGNLIAEMDREINLYMEKFLND